MVLKSNNFNMAWQLPYLCRAKKGLKLYGENSVSNNTLINISRMHEIYKENFYIIL